MANYIAHCRSNYLEVKDEAAFRAWAASRELDVEADHGGFMVYADGSWSYCIEDEDGEWEDIDFLAELSEHLAEGHMAVLMEVGNEKLRYLVGEAHAVNAQNKRASVDIDQIYGLAESLGEHVTSASY